MSALASLLTVLLANLSNSGQIALCRKLIVIGRRRNENAVVFETQYDYLMSGGADAPFMSARRPVVLCKARIWHVFKE